MLAFDSGAVWYDQSKQSKHQLEQLKRTNQFDDIELQFARLSIPQLVFEFRSLEGLRQHVPSPDFPKVYPPLSFETKASGISKVLLRAYYAQSFRQLFEVKVSTVVVQHKLIGTSRK